MQYNGKWWELGGCQQSVRYFNLFRRETVSKENLIERGNALHLLSTTRRICPKYGEIQTGMYFFCIHQRPGTMDIECD